MARWFPMDIDRMVATVGGSTHHQVFVVRNRDVLFQGRLGKTLLTPEEALEACQGPPVDWVTVEL